MSISDDIKYVRRKLRKIILLASNGFYRTIDDQEKINNRFFLEIIKESYKALNTINQVDQRFIEGLGESNARDNEQRRAG